MAVIKRITKSQREYTCSRCGDTIPEGSAYQYFKPGFRGRVKVRRCMKPECTPRRSELADNKMADVYAAQEDAESTIRDLKWSDEGTWEEQIASIEEVLTGAAETAEGVGNEYSEAIDATPMLEERVGEQRDALEEWAGELQSFEPSNQPEDEPDASEGTEARQDWLAQCSEAFDQAVEEALEVLGNLAV